MALVLNPGEAANLLSLDGGGVKGISTLVILKAIMDKVQVIEDGNADRKSKVRLPVDYFHLGAGTSTGGIIALMLFRLRMSPDQAIAAYNKMASKIFGTKLHGGTASYSDVPLRAAIEEIMAEYGPAEDKETKGKSKLVNNKGKMFMCSTLQERGESILLRSYTPPADAVPVSENGKTLFEGGIVQNITISEAARATSAAPTYFPQVTLPDTGTAPTQGTPGVVFWDGGLLNNNPIDQLWRARLDLVGVTDPAPKVACVLSIGTSWASVNPPSFFDSFLPKPDADSGIIAAAKNLFAKGGNMVKDQIYHMLPVLKPVEEMIPFLTNTEAKHLDFSRYMKRLEKRTSEADAQTQYFRFNTPTKDFYMDMADSSKMEQLADITRKWVASPDASSYIEKCARILAKKAPTK